MESCINAIRSYFEAKNQVWVTGDVEALLRAGGSLHGAKWAVNWVRTSRRRSDPCSTDAVDCFDTL